MGMSVKNLEIYDKKGSSHENYTACCRQNGRQIPG